MSNSDDAVPVWTLATEDTVAPRVSDEESMTPGRLAELRTVLAALVDSPLATLEAHPLPQSADLSRGTELGSSSPLAGLLAGLIDETRQSGAGPLFEAASETLFRLVVPAKVATQFGNTLGTSKATDEKSWSVLDNGAQLTKFVPVAAKIAGGGGVGAITVAAPLVLMAVAAGLNALAERDRNRTDRVLQAFKDEALRTERATYNACITSIDLAANILLDEGRVGSSLGLDTAAFQINIGLANAEARIEAWEQATERFKTTRVEARDLHRSFEGIGESGGEFYAQLELAKLSIELSKRLAVLQAVQHAQLEPTNEFKSFTRALARHTKRVELLQDRLSAVLERLSELQVDRSHGVRDFAFSSSEVDSILGTARRIRSLGSQIETKNSRADVAVEIAKKVDGSLVVLPATTV